MDERPSPHDDDELAMLREENARMAALLAGTDDVLRRSFASAPLGMAILQAEPPRYLEVNAAFADFLGRTREEILAADPYVFWAQITHPEDFVVEQVKLAQLVAGEIESYEMRKRFLRPDGRLRWGILAFSSVRRPDGTLHFGIGQIADVHESVLAEERRQKAQKLEALGQLAGGIAHDFNNLLTILMGYADLLCEQLPEDDARRAHAVEVLGSAQRGAALTRQLLAYGRGQMLVPAVFPASEGVAAVCGLVGRLLGVGVRLEQRMEARGHVELDAAQLEQIVMNLVLNARDALPRGGTITVETSDLELSASSAPSDLPPGSYVRLSVTDDGVGMTDEVRARLFEPFFTTKEPGRGTGLGLATVWGLVKQSGGAVNVVSAPGAGTRFDVTFPRAAARPAAAALVAAAPAVHRSATLLLAEDDPAVRRLLAEVLRTAGYEVLAAESAEDALALARVQPIDLAISDMVMPRANGMALVEELRALRPELPTLVVSGYTEQAASLATSRGAASYLFKPFVPATLVARVRALLT